jgi:dUTP pyrophosphatase
VEGGARIRFRKLRPGAATPRYMSDGAAGLDLASAADGPLRLEARGGRIGVPTGLALEIPPGFEGQVRPRSGLAIRAGVTVLNAPGTIDSDYRGELMVLLVNLGEEAYTITPGDRIAQLVIAPVTRGELEEVSQELSTTQRGDGGFGHTG